MFQLVSVRDFEKSGAVRGTTVFCFSTRACSVPQKPLPMADAFNCSGAKDSKRPHDECSGAEGSSGGRRAAGWKQPRGKYLQGTAFRTGRAVRKTASPAHQSLESPLPRRCLQPAASAPPPELPQPRNIVFVKHSRNDHLPVSSIDLPVSNYLSTSI